MQQVKFVQLVRTGYRGFSSSTKLCSVLAGYTKSQQQSSLLLSPYSAARLPHLFLQCNYGTKEAPGLLTRIAKSLGLFKSVNRTRGFKLYELVERQVKVQPLFLDLKLPDTFHSWFVIMELHIWMMMARLMAEGDEGRDIRNGLIEALWQDVDFKAQKLGDLAASVRRKQIKLLDDEFRAFIFSFDEAILSQDHVLAGALWRCIYSQQEFDPRHLEILVQYVRENMAALDKTSFEDLLDTKFKWTEVKL